MPPYKCHKCPHQYWLGEVKFNKHKNEHSAVVTANYSLPLFSCPKCGKYRLDEGDDLPSESDVPEKTFDEKVRGCQEAMFPILLFGVIMVASFAKCTGQL